MNCFLLFFKGFSFIQGQGLPQSGKVRDSHFLPFPIPVIINQQLIIVTQQLNSSVFFPSFFLSPFPPSFIFLVLIQEKRVKMGAEGGKNP